MFNTASFINKLKQMKAIKKETNEKGNIILTCEKSVLIGLVKKQVQIIADVISRFFFPPKHDFDLENPIIDEITTTHEYKLSGTKAEKKWTVIGFQCKKCGKILWLEKLEMKQLPRCMKYGCSR